MKWQKGCPHGLSCLIPPTANPTGIMGSYTWDKTVRTWSWQSHPVLTVWSFIFTDPLSWWAVPTQWATSPLHKQTPTSWNLWFYSSDCND
jgi:hypothetical protein